MTGGIIENLTSISFIEYGEVIRAGIAGAMDKIGCKFMKQREISEKYIKGLYINRTMPTILDIFEGTAILYIGKTPEKLKAFLLDKTVIINPDTYFIVTPLLVSATISVSADRNFWPDFIESPQELNPVGINSSININRIYTFLYHEKELGFHFKGESHDIWELNYVDKGSVYCVIGDEDRRTYELKQGELMLCTPGQWHEHYADDDVLASYVSIAFDMDFADYDVFANRTFSYDKEISELLKKMLREKENMDGYSQDMILCYLKELLVRLMRISKIETIIDKSDLPVKINIENDIERHVKEYIRKNINKKLSVSSIAKEIPVNASYLSTLFKRNTGETLIEYINKEKLNKATEYIRCEKYTFTEIANMLSFNSVHYFSKKFKTQFGITPSEYSKALKK